MRRLDEPDELVERAAEALALARRVHSLLMERVFPRQADVITVAQLKGLLP